MSGCSKNCAKYKERKLAYERAERARHGSHGSIRRQLTYSSESEPSLPQTTPNYRSVKSEATELQSLSDTESDESLRGNFDDYDQLETPEPTPRRGRVHEDTDKSIDVVGFTPEPPHSHGRSHRETHPYEERTPEPTPDGRGRRHLAYQKTPNLTPRDEIRTGHREYYEDQETPEPTPDRLTSCGANYGSSRTPDCLGRSGRSPMNEEYTPASSGRTGRSTRFDEQTPEVSGRTRISRFNVSTPVPSGGSRRNPRFDAITPEITPRSPEAARDETVHRALQIQAPPNRSFRHRRTPEKNPTVTSNVDLLSIPSTSIPDIQSGPTISTNQTSSRKFDSLFSGYVMEEESSEENCSTVRDSSSGYLSCPQLCEKDPTLIRYPKLNDRCHISCSRRLILEIERERRQAEVDNYLLRGGLRYFDELCCCSLKHVVEQIYRDRFVRQTATSAIFFFLGIHLCWELEFWYIPF